MVTAAVRLKTLAPWKKSYDQPRQHIKKQRCHLLTKGHIVKAVVSAAVMYRCAVHGVTESNMTERLNDICNHTTKPRLNVWNQCPLLMERLEEESLTWSTYVSFK